MNISNLRITAFLFVLALFYPSIAAADTSVSGDIFLPGGVAVDREVSVQVSLCPSDWQNCSYQSVTIAQGSTSAPFSLTSTSPLEHCLRYSAYNYTDIIYPDGYSIPPTGRSLSTWSDEGEVWITPDSTVSNILFEMYGGTTVSGQITGPEGGFSEDKVLYIGWYNADTGSSYTDYTPLLTGVSSLGYEISVPTTVAEYNIGYYWDYWYDVIPTGYVREGFHKGPSPDDTAYYRSQALSFYPADGTQTNVNMTLLEGDPIIGNIFLPTGFTESQNVTVSLNINSSDYSISENRTITVYAGDAFADFNITVPATDPGTLITVSYYMYGESDNVYIDQGFYRASGTTSIFSEREYFDSTNPPASVDLTLIPASIFEGTFTVPAAITAAADCSVKISAYNSLGYTFAVLGDSIPAGQNQLSWNLELNPENGDVIIGYEVTSQLPEGYVGFGFYHPDGTVGIKSLAAPLPSAASHDLLNMNLLTGHIISGSLHVFDNESFSSDSGFTVSAISDSAGMQYPWFGTLSADETSVSYTVTIPEDAAPFNLLYGWSGTAAPSYYRYGYYNSNGTVLDKKQGTPLSPTADMPNIDMTILRAYTISGKIMFPIGITSPDDLPVILGAVNDTDELYDTTVIILGNQPEVNYSVNIPYGSESATVGYVIDTMDLVRHGFYDVGGTVGLIENSTMLANTTDHTEKNITLIEGNALSGQIAIPDVLPEDLPISLGAISDIESVYHTTVIIAANDLQADYSVRFAPDQTPVSLGFQIPPEADLPTQGYYRSASTGNVTGGLLLADSFLSDSTLNGILIPAGNSVEGEITLPAGYTVATPLPIKIGLIASPAVPDSLYWLTTVVISPGETSTSYSAKLVIDSDLYAGYSNESTLDLLPMGFYAGPGNEPVSSPDPNFTLGQLLDHTNIDFAIHSATEAMGDVNFDGTADLEDLILTLQILTGQPLSKEVIRQADINGDGVLSLQEAVYIMQKTAE